METKPSYSNSSPKTLEAFRNRNCSLLFTDPSYEPPSPEDIDMLINLAGWSKKRASEIAGVVYNPKGSSALYKWRTAIGSTEHRKIPYAAWRLMLLYAGVVECPYPGA